MRRILSRKCYSSYSIGTEDTEDEHRDSAAPGGEAENGG